MSVIEKKYRSPGNLIHTPIRDEEDSPWEAGHVLGMFRDQDLASGGLYHDYHRLLPLINRGMSFKFCA